MPLVLCLRSGSGHRDPCIDGLLCSTRKRGGGKEAGEWGRAMEERGLNISRKKTEYLRCNGHPGARRGPFTGIDSRVVHIYGIKVSIMLKYTHDYMYF